MKKNIIAAFIGTALIASSLTGCGSTASAAKSTESASTSSEAQGTAASSETPATETSSSEAASSEAAGEYDFTSDPIDLKIGVVGSLYEDLWKNAVDTLKGEGINLEIVQFSDYVTPNNALANGEIDLNAFQHQIYLKSEIDQYGYDLTNIGNTFIIPLNLYSEKIKSVEELKDGDTIAVPNDPTNEGRALKVLAAAGLITLKDNDNFNPTLDDIESYKVNVKIEELAANTIPSTLPDVTAAIVNGNYALDFGLKTDEAVYKDSVLDQEEYWNLIAAKTADLSDARLVAAYEKVVKAFQSEATEKVFNDDFGGYFIKAGWDQDRLADFK
ncbi:MAG: ABC transporter substrate-binding protein [Lachnospiraceae bacterium]|nr:ABC transporter substrate-binding protein [Lachnospiraceae bacterium]